jgi:hypothetical protein
MPDTDKIVEDLFDDDGILNGANLSVVIVADTIASEPIDPDWYSRIRLENRTAIVNSVNNALMVGMIMGGQGLSPDEASVRKMGENMPVVMEALAKMIQFMKDQELH